MSLALWLLVYMLLAFGIGRLYEITLGWRTVSLVFYPGMLVAAGGRWLACLIGQHKGGADVFRTGGPSSGGADSQGGGWWFRFLYAVLPFAAVLLSFVFVWHLLGEPLSFDRPLPKIGFESSAVEDTAHHASSALSGIFDSLGRQRLGDWRMWLFLYLGWAFIVASAPARDDMIVVGVFSAVVGVIVFVLAQAGVEVVAGRVYRGAFWDGFSFLVAMGLLVLVATAILILPLKLIRRPKEK